MYVAVCPAVIVADVEQLPPEGQFAPDAAEREKSCTFSVSAAEVLPAKAAGGTYTAVIECAPVMSEPVFNEA